MNLNVPSPPIVVCINWYVPGVSLGVTVVVKSRLGNPALLVAVIVKVCSIPFVKPVIVVVSSVD